MSIMYKSTRSNSDKVTASQAILKGLADDGGLFVPDSIPALEVPLEKLAENKQLMAYKHKGYWKCMDTQRDKMQLEELIKNGEAPWIKW